MYYQGYHPAYNIGNTTDTTNQLEEKIDTCNNKINKLTNELMRVRDEFDDYKCKINSNMEEYKYQCNIENRDKEEYIKKLESVINDYKHLEDKNKLDHN